MSDPLARPTRRLFDAAAPLNDPRVQGRLVVGVLGIASLLLLPRLLAPVAFGWQRAERMLEIEEELDYLRDRHEVLQEEIQYRKTPAGQALTATEVLMLTYPRARVVHLVPRTTAPQSVTSPTLGARVKGWREKGRTTLHHKWRVFNLLFLDRRLPAEPSN
jgi:hypothetical protein